MLALAAVRPYTTFKSLAMLILVDVICSWGGAVVEQLVSEDHSNLPLDLLQSHQKDRSAKSLTRKN